MTGLCAVPDADAVTNTSAPTRSRHGCTASAQTLQFSAPQLTARPKSFCKSGTVTFQLKPACNRQYSAFRPHVWSIRYLLSSSNIPPSHRTKRCKQSMYSTGASVSIALTKKRLPSPSPPGWGRRSRPRAGAWTGCSRTAAQAACAPSGVGTDTGARAREVPAHVKRGADEAITDTQYNTGAEVE